MKLLSDNGQQVRFELSRSVYRLMSVPELATDLHHAMGNGGIERVTHTAVQMLAFIVNER